MADGHARVAGKQLIDFFIPDPPDIPLKDVGPDIFIAKDEEGNETPQHGRRYILRAMLIGMYAEFEAYQLTFREDPLAIAARACLVAPPQMHESIWKNAMKMAQSARVISAEDSHNFEQSPRGTAFKLWCMVRGQHGIPEAREKMFDGVDACMRLLEQVGEARLFELMAKMQAVSGEDDLKNSSGPKQEVKAPMEAQEAGGPSSISGLPTNTTGTPIPSTP